MIKHTRRLYDDEDRARTAVLLEANNNNAKKTAREMGIPLSTVRTWRRQWNATGYPAGMEDLATPIRSEFADAMKDVRWQMLDALQEQVHRRQLKGRDLIVGIGILSDKIQILTGLATSRAEKKVTQTSTPNPDEMAKVLASYIGNTVESAETRVGEIEEVSTDQQGKPALVLVK